MKTYKIHPLAGQGLNMTIRDIESAAKYFNKKIKLGLPLDSSVFVEFQKLLNIIITYLQILLILYMNF